MGGIGERLKSARTAAGLSLRDLAAQVGVSATAISKYERNEDVPGSGVLLRLAKSLDVRVEYFLRPIAVEVSEPSYRKRASLGVRARRSVLARIQDGVERHMEAESLYPGEEQRTFCMPLISRSVHSYSEIETVAIALRADWNLGLDPVESVVEVLEEQGIKVQLVDAPETFDACTYTVNGVIPVIAVRRGVPGDRQRLNLLHELGHLLLQVQEGLDEERAAFRFAAAFLVPEPMARFELGPHRNAFSLEELQLLKKRWGLSMQAWIRRANDLGIITEAAAVRYYKLFRTRGWHRAEPGGPYPEEEPGRLFQLVLRARAEDVISDARAAELLGKSVRAVQLQRLESLDESAANVCR